MQTPWHRMDDSERRKWQDPEAILGGIGLRSGSTFVDVGCGRGFFTLAAARVVGAGGKVYGVDTDGGAIEDIRKRAAAQRLGNIMLVEGKAEDTVFCDACADVVFFGIVLHDFEDPAKVLRNAARMLKPEGVLSNLDWKKQPMPFGPPLERRFDEAKATGLIRAAGLTVEPVRDSGPYHYIITARQKAFGMDAARK